MRYFKKITKKFWVRCIQSVFYFLCGDLRECENKKASSILVVRLDEIGDMVMLTPFLRELHRWNSLAQITLVVKPGMQELFQYCPYVNVVKEFHSYSGKMSIFNACRAYWFCKHHLSAEYDLVIVPRWDSDAWYGAGYVAMCSRGKKRIAYSSCVNKSKNLSDDGFDLFYTDTLKETWHVHEVERNLDILRYLGADIQSDELELWERKRKNINFFERTCPRRNKIRLIVFLSCGAPKKEWKVKNYVQTIGNVSKYYDVEVILGGAGRRAKHNAEEFKRYYPNTIDLVDQTSLAETVALIKACDCYLGGDTGPTHMAAACGVPGVALYLGIYGVSRGDLETPERFGPWKSRLIVIQPEYLSPGCEKGCIKGYSHCINNITVESVSENLLRVLSSVAHEKYGVID